MEPEKIWCKHIVCHMGEWFFGRKTVPVKDEVFFCQTCGAPRPGAVSPRYTPDDFQVFCDSTAIYPEGVRRVLNDEKREMSPQKLCQISYCVLGLVGEAGEIANKLKKAWRDNTFDKKDIAKELGDVAYYLAQTLTELGFSLEEVMKENNAKLAARKAAGTLKGSGDSR